MDVFEEANNRLETFIENNLSSYHELRNYDYGIHNRSNISKISKYTAHRILYEYDLIKRLKIIDKKKKFTDEILWRLYWRGYLENHKSIWSEYKNFKKYSCNSDQLKKANDGNTGIEFFDIWIKELKENNYLHNHSRMWFASIWIFTFKLPWQLGASLFMKHLYDGDSASNTLSWRWVAGMHTNKKPYIASIDNISKYTFNRFRNSSYNLSKGTNAITTNSHQDNTIPTQKSFLSDKNILLMFDNDLYLNKRLKLFSSYSKVYILFNNFIEHMLILSENVVNFKHKLLLSVNKLIPNSKVFNVKDLDILLENIKSVDVIYPGIGNNLDLINKFSMQRKINVNYIFRKEDLIYWNYANSGYYKFKKKFYETNNL